MDWLTGILLLANVVAVMAMLRAIREQRRRDQWRRLELLLNNFTDNRN